MTVIAIANQKGGVAKTTTAVFLAHHFALQGRRTLVVDFDVQGQVATFLGLEKANGLYRLLVDAETPEVVAVDARDGLDVIRNDKSNERVVAHMMQTDFREFAVAQALDKARRYDLIFLDMPPSTNVLHVASLVAADFVIIPTKMDYASLEGAAEILGTIRSLNRIPGVQPPQLIGVLPTVYERVTTATVDSLRQLQDAVGVEQVLPPIPSDTRVREANARGLTIWEYAPNSPAAIGYPNGQTVRNSRGGVGGYLHLAEITERMISGKG